MLPNILNRKIENLFILVFSVLLVVLNIMRIIHVPVTHDEGITFMNYISLPYGEIIGFKDPSANNHILNTLLSKWLMSVFHNQGVFVLRMGSLLAQIAYMVWGWLIIKKIFTNSFWRIGAFIILNCNPFLFEFWGLCRGYGIAIAAMIGSIYFLLAYIQTKRVKDIWLSLLPTMVGVYSNFGLLNFYMALCAIFFIGGCIERHTFKRVFFPLLFCAALLAVLIVKPIILLRSHNELYYGGDNGIIADTISTLLVDCFHVVNKQAVTVNIAAYVVGLSGFLPGVYWIGRAINERPEKNDMEVRYGVVLWLLLIIPCLAIMLQHILLGTKLLISRTALFLVPLFLLSLLNTLTKMAKSSKGYLAVILCMPMLLNFFIVYSIDKSWSWNRDNNNATVLKHIVAEKKQGTSKIKLRVDWQFAPGIQYYTTAYYADKFEPVVYTHADVTADSSYDYYYIFQVDTSILNRQYVIDTIFSERGVLMRRR